MSKADTHINDFGGLVTNSSHATDEMVVEMDSVSKWYGDFQVLTDCTAHVHRGDVVVVCGPSGSGKSTLIKTVNGLEPFQKGEIMVNGISVGDSKTNLPKLRSRVGMVFQHFELFPHLTIIDNLTVAQIKSRSCGFNRPSGKVSSRAIWWTTTTCRDRACIGDGSNRYVV